MIVVDASALTAAIVLGGLDGARLRARLGGESLIGPDFVRIEVVSALRRNLATGSITAHQVALAIETLIAFPIVTHPTLALLNRVWELRNNVSPYDACYVALAEAFNCTLLTADVRLANAPTLRCTVELF